MADKVRIAAAGNTVTPAYLTLIESGYTVSMKPPESDSDDELWFAENDRLEVIGDSPLELLALVRLFEARGPDWRAGDDEIDQFLERFYGDSDP